MGEVGGGGGCKSLEREEVRVNVQIKLELVPLLKPTVDPAHLLELLGNVLDFKLCGVGVGWGGGRERERERGGVGEGREREMAVGMGDAGAVDASPCSPTEYHPRRGREAAGARLPP